MGTYGGFVYICGLLVIRLYLVISICICVCIDIVIYLP